MTIFFTDIKLLTIVILRRHYWSTACKRSSLTRRSRSSVPSFSVRPPSHCSQGDSYSCNCREASCILLMLPSFLVFLQNGLQCPSWQDHSGAPGQRADKVAHRENHLKLLLAPANAPGAASDKPRINSGATHPLDK